MILKTFFHQLILICNKREKEEKNQMETKKRSFDCNRNESRREKTQN
jgi:hypothetical protein